MAATVELHSLHGASGAATASIDGQTIKYKMADNDTNDANNPIPVPTSGTQNSWIKHFRLKVTVAPANGINNLKFYTDGSNGLGTGLDLLVKASATYLDPTSGASFAGGASAFTYTAGSPLALTGSIAATTGFVGDYLQSMMQVSSTAQPGNSGSEQLTVSFDEY